MYTCFLVFLNIILFLLEALNDSKNAIELDEKNIKAYLRQGTALYNQDLKDEALKAFERGLEIDCKYNINYIPLNSID